MSNAGLGFGPIGRGFRRSSTVAEPNSQVVTKIFLGFRVYVAYHFGVSSMLPSSWHLASGEAG